MHAVRIARARLCLHRRWPSALTGTSPDVFRCLLVWPLKPRRPLPVVQPRARSRAASSSNCRSINTQYRGVSNLAADQRTVRSSLLQSTPPLATPPTPTTPPSPQRVARARALATLPCAVHSLPLPPPISALQYQPHHMRHILRHLKLEPKSTGRTDQA
ncbi:uncharacterized protein FIBRA_09063 [Fibroporia radiculosa]|uniref:Uncharacterized protein n=1 Tax=Fibroporia radiculosa TaxID=599839 RepID=J4GXV5_9APHY|nr:uncharacterized protein FIBRA_09063 [Fibroporia radiculosa]CCM06765.1 predicted protein [Fibroporia radiculosa]